MTGDPKIDRAASLLFQAGHMLRMEANEWRSRRREPSIDWMRNEGDKSAWAAKCESVAKNNDAAADAMLKCSDELMP